MLSKIFFFAFFAVCNVMCDKPTVRPAQSFDQKADAAKLNKALEQIIIIFEPFPGSGLGESKCPNESAIVEILPHRSFNQRLEIDKAYKKLYPKKNLTKEFDKKLSADFRLAVLMLMTAPQELFDRDIVKSGDLTIGHYARNKVNYAVKKLKDAIKGPGTKEKELNRIIAWRSEIDLGDIKDAYKTQVKSDLCEDVKDDTSGYYCKLLITLLGCKQKCSNTP